MNPAYTKRDSKPDFSRTSSRSTLQSAHAFSRSPSVASAASFAPSVSATPSIRSILSERSVHKGQSAPTLPKKSRPVKERLVRLKKTLHQSFKKRPEGRKRVPEKIRGSLKEFFFSHTGMLKVLRMCIIAGAVYCFIVGRAENVLIAITIQETFIVLFFVIIYMVSLQHLLVCVHWPLLDLINSCMSAVFLGLIGIRTIEEKGRKKLVYIGGVLCLFASILCVFDALMVVKTMRSNRKKAPRIVPATAPSRPNLR